MFAQSSDSLKKRAPWFLSFSLEPINLHTYTTNWKTSYTGEYLNETTNHISWISKDSQLNYRHPSIANFASRFTVVKMDMLISKSPDLRFGLSYNLGVINWKRKSDDPIFWGGYETGNQTFLGISGLVDYVHVFHKDKTNGVFGYGSAAIGGYRATSYLEGIGTELFIQEKLGIGYRMKRYFEMRMALSNDLLTYSDHTISTIYKKEMNYKSNLHNAYLMFGFTKCFRVIPD